MYVAFITDAYSRMIVGYSRPVPPCRMVEPFPGSTFPRSPALYRGVLVRPGRWVVDGIVCCFGNRWLRLRNRLGEHRLHQLALGLLDLRPQERPDCVRLDAGKLGKPLERRRLARRRDAGRDHEREGYSTVGRQLVKRLAHRRFELAMMRAI